MRRAVAVLVLAVLTLASQANAGAKGRPPRLSDHSGIHVVQTQRLSDRLLDVTVATRALAGPVHVRVLVPHGYARAHERYPVLYLLHGALDDYRSWSDKGAAEKITAGLPLIVVMPEAGDHGWYADWDNYGSGGPPMWETFHIRQLIGWVDTNFRTIANRAGRGVAGLSMGGLGTMSYAARHPDLFTSAASFSGAVDTNHEGGVALIEVSGQGTQSVYGPRATNEVNWRGHNPVDLAENLRGMTLGIYGGNGQPHAGQCCLPLDPIEYGTHEMSINLHEHFKQLGIPHRWVTGLGQHQWGDWQTYLRDWVPVMMSAFAHPRDARSGFVFSAVEPHYEIYGWKVVISRPALEFSTLRVADSGEFSLTGSGSAQVITAAQSSPGRVARVWWMPEGGRCSSKRLRADASGRLVLTVPLGPGNTAQEYTAAAEMRTARYTTTVYLGHPGALCS
jgi:S-formylglutathione hydrolase FrmB